MNHTRLQKEVHLPDWARRDKQGTKGDNVEGKETLAVNWHWQKPGITRHVQRNALETQVINHAVTRWYFRRLLLYYHFEILTFITSVGSVTLVWICFLQSIVTFFYVLLTVHLYVILWMKPTWCTIFSVYFVNFIYNLYMFWTSPGPSSGFIQHQVSYKHSYSSWWWTWRSPKHVEQRFSNCGPRTTSGPRVLPLWSF